MGVPMQKIAVVTGGSSGIGRAAALALQQKGCRVYTLSRHELPAPGIVHLNADVTDEAQVLRAIGQVLALEGRIDILVNNAGFGISGPAELTPSQLAHRQMEVNLFGMDRVTRAVLPAMRSQGSGRILCVSSIAGILPIPFQLWYSVSKSAVISYCLALANELRPEHISVCAILPGDIATGFTGARVKLPDNGPYAARVRRSVEKMEQDERNGKTPAWVGRRIARCAMKKRSRPVVALGFFYQCAAVLAKLLPRRLSNWLIGMLYGH